MKDGRPCVLGKKARPSVFHFIQVLLNLRATQSMKRLELGDCRELASWRLVEYPDSFKLRGLAMVGRSCFPKVPLNHSRRVRSGSADDNIAQSDCRRHTAANPNQKSNFNGWGC